jgi:Skp family chaperone for outer membrane proteins
MKLNSSKFLQGAIALAIFSIGTYGYAQGFSKVAVVDMSIVMKEYWRAKESREQFEKLSAGYQKEQSDKQAAMKLIQVAGQQLVEEIQKDPAMSDAKKKQKESELKQKGDELRLKQQELVAFGQTASKILQDKQQYLGVELMGDIDKAISQLAKNKYTMVFVKPQVRPDPGALIFSESLDDLTQQVLGVLNKDAPAGKKDDKKEDKK